MLDKISYWLINFSSIVSLIPSLNTIPTGPSGHTSFHQSILQLTVAQSHFFLYILYYNNGLAIIINNYLMFYFFVFTDRWNFMVPTVGLFLQVLAFPQKLAQG